MYKSVFRGIAILFALGLVSFVAASEPAGTVIVRYHWPDKTDRDPDAPRLRLSMTAAVNLTAARLTATPPTGIQLIVRAAGRAPASWPEEGLAIGDVAAGQTVLVELDVARPPRGGGIVGFLLQANADGREVREGVGVPVGVPGAAPTIRNGAVEFPAAPEDKTP